MPLFQLQNYFILHFHHNYEKFRLGQLRLILLSLRSPVFLFSTKKRNNCEQAKREVTISSKFTPAEPLRTLWKLNDYDEKQLIKKTFFVP